MGKQGGAISVSYGQISRRDLINFDREATDLVLEMIEAGWVGRISQRGHAIMRAPDGETSHSVSRDSLRGRSGRNARGVFERWKRQQAVSKHPSSKPKSDNVIQLHPSNFEVFTPDFFVCGVQNCGKTFETKQGLSAHKKSHNPWTTCPLCGQPARVLGQHFRFHHTGQRVADVVGVPPVDAPVEPQNAPEAQTHVIEVGDAAVATVVVPAPLSYPEPVVPEPVSVLTTPLSAMDALMQVLTELEALREENARLRAALEVR